MSRCPIVVALLITCAATLMALGIAVPASAEGDATTESAASTTQPEQMETKQAAEATYHKKQICRQEVLIGSRIPRTVCRTQAQMDANRDAAKKWKNDSDRMPQLVYPADTAKPR